ncbi:hypothetical protein AYI69_g5061 [Smittium culicis]|uniref:Uncharacterized protein n=1 Tax=Smittium culicis TaxID=133412 RepID=A0A1R1Y8D6_9FUNG|nr:hypothetical protein AYI69_g5061 [Smittium culicis]
MNAILIDYLPPFKKQKECYKAYPTSLPDDFSHMRDFVSNQIVQSSDNPEAFASSLRAGVSSEYVDMSVYFLVVMTGSMLHQLAAETDQQGANAALMERPDLGSIVELLNYFHGKGAQFVANCFRAGYLNRAPSSSSEASATGRSKGGIAGKGASRGGSGSESGSVQKSGLSLQLVISNDDSDFGKDLFGGGGGGGSNGNLAEHLQTVDALLVWLKRGPVNEKVKRGSGPQFNSNSRRRRSSSSTRYFGDGKVEGERQALDNGDNTSLAENRSTDVDTSASGSRNSVAEATNNKAPTASTSSGNISYGVGGSNIGGTSNKNQDTRQKPKSRSSSTMPAADIPFLPPNRQLMYVIVVIKLYSIHYYVYTNYREFFERYEHVNHLYSRLRFIAEHYGFLPGQDIFQLDVPSFYSAR